MKTFRILFTKPFKDLRPKPCDPKPLQWASQTYSTEHDAIQKMHELASKGLNVAMWVSDPIFWGDRSYLSKKEGFCEVSRLAVIAAVKETK
jgi:hypothetical protein